MTYVLAHKLLNLIKKLMYTDKQQDYFRFDPKNWKFISTSWRPDYRRNGNTRQKNNMIVKCWWINIGKMNDLFFIDF